MKKHHGSSFVRLYAGIPVVLVMVSSMILAACGDAVADDEPSIAPDNPYAAEFTGNYNEATTPLVKGILKDGVITEAEMNEFADMFGKCVADIDNRLEWSWTESDGETVHVDAGDAVDTNRVSEVLTQCHEKTDYDHIMPLHDFISNNPDNLSADEYNTKILECMKSYDLVDRNMDPDYFLSFYSAPGGTETPEYKKYLGPLTDEHDPNYDSAKSERFFQCMTDPLGLKQ